MYDQHHTVTWRGTRYNLTNIMLAVLITLVTLTSVPAYIYLHGLSWSLVLGYAFFHLVPGYCVTAGYHRLFSHQAYKAHWALRLFYAVFGAAALQNNILSWSAQHRVHHRHVDDPERDPYPITRGFLHAHIGWLLSDEKQLDYPKGLTRDLEQDWVVQFQRKYYWWLVALTNIALPLAIGFAVGRPGGFMLICVLLRLFIVENVVFSVNSFCHMWGRQPYTDLNTARDSHILGLLILGEGYHNYHHRFEYDYRNGCRLFELDSTKWIIWGLSRLGLAHSLRRANLSQIMAARTGMAIKRAKARAHKRAEKLAIWHDWIHSPEWQARHARLEDMRNELITRMHAWEDLLEEKRALRAQKHQPMKERLAELQYKMAEARITWGATLKIFREQLLLCRRLQPVPIPVRNRPQK